MEQYPPTKPKEPEECYVGQRQEPLTLAETCKLLGAEDKSKGQEPVPFMDLFLGRSRR